MLVLTLALATLPSGQARAEVDVCGPSARQCTRMALPLDRSGAVPGTVVLEVQRARATTPTAAPVFLLAGGPGQSATRAYERATIRKLLGREALRRDVVVIDQRGTGSSGALNCPTLQQAGSLSLADAAARCAALLGPARPFFTTADSVADIEAVRIALGYDRIALLAVSYGTVVAEQYARAHPDR